MIHYEILKQILHFKYVGSDYDRGIQIEVSCFPNMCNTKKYVRE